MGIKWSELSERQKGMVEGGAGIPLESAKIDSEAVLGKSKVKSAPGRLERQEQGLFANWLLQQGLPFVWHATHAPSKATPGTPDFWVGCRGKGMWIEFKGPGGKMSACQLEFSVKLTLEGLDFFIVHSAAEAIELVRFARGG